MNPLFQLLGIGLFTMSIALLSVLFYDYQKTKR